MENDNVNVESSGYVAPQNDMKKKGKVWILIVVIILIVVAMILVVLKMQNQKAMELENLSNAGLNEAILKDTTKSMDDSLNNINIEDTTSEDLKIIDQELENL